MIPFAFSVELQPAIAGLVGILTLTGITAGIVAWFARNYATNTINDLEKANAALGARVDLLEADNMRKEQHILALEARHLAVESLADSCRRIAEDIREHVNTETNRNEIILDHLRRIERKMA